MAERIAATLRAGDVVTVKGSHGIRMDKIVSRLIADAARCAAKG